MFDVPPAKLMPLSMQVASVSVNYTLPAIEKRALRRASSVLAGLAKNKGLAPVDPDRQMPLLSRANAPSAEDRELIGQAKKLLWSDVRTYDLGQELKWLEARWPEHGAVEGWRWLRAAHVMLGPRVPEQARGSLPYLAGIARGFKEADRHRPFAAKDVAPLRASDLKGLF
jgi:hypothetical protein